MPATNTKAGRMACETCGDPVWVKRTGGGKLAYRCEACGSGHFAEAGDRAWRKWAKTMTPHTDPDAEPTEPPAEPAPAARKPPARKPAAEPAGFNLGL